MGVESNGGVRPVAREAAGWSHIIPGEAMVLATSSRGVTSPVLSVTSQRPKLSPRAW